MPIILGAMLSAAMLSGCSSAPKLEPRVQIVEVKVPVPVPCKAEVDVRESYSDAAAEFAADIYEQVKALLAGREERMADAERMRGAIVGCGGAVK